MEAKRQLQKFALSSGKDTTNTLLFSLIMSKT